MPDSILAPIITETRVALTLLDRLFRSLADEDFELGVDEVIAVADSIGAASARLRRALADLEDHDCHDEVPAPLAALDARYVCIMHLGGQKLDLSGCRVEALAANWDAGQAWLRKQQADGNGASTSYIAISDLAPLLS